MASTSSFHPHRAESHDGAQVPQAEDPDDSDFSEDSFHMSLSEDHKAGRPGERGEGVLPSSEGARS